MGSAEEALAFWLREPGAGEIRVGGSRPPAPTRSLRAHPSVGRQPGHRVAGVRRARPAQPVRRHAGPLPGRRLPRAGEVRLPQRGGRGGGSRRAASVAPCSACTPTRRAYVVPASAVTVVPAGRACGAGGARRNRRDGRERAVGRRTAGRRPGGRRRGRDPGLLRGPAARPHPRGLRHAGRHRPHSRRRRVGARAWTSPFPSRRRPVATWSSTRAPPPPGLQQSLELLAPEGTVIELSWYGDDETTVSARRVLPLGSPRGPGQPGRHGRPGPTRAPDDGRPARARPRPAPGPGLRRPADRRVPVRGHCPR